MEAVEVGVRTGELGATIGANPVGGSAIGDEEGGGDGGGGADAGGGGAYVVVITRL